MSQQSIHGSGPRDEEKDHAEAVAGGQVFASAQGAEDILDEVDSVLESNSEAFVRSFVQKGGE
jgi:ubiquitin-like protein Pup